MDWRQFWNEDHSIYVNARHRLLHADLVAKGIGAYIPSPAARVLDWGCGRAEAAETLAAQCGRLYLFDSAPRVRRDLIARYAGKKNIMILGESGVGDVEDGGVDLVAIVSVVQYLPREDFRDLLASLVPKLAAGGKVVVADIIPRGLSPMEDAKALLAFGWRGGFLIASLFGLARTYFSNYRQLRATVGLKQWDDDEIIHAFEVEGFEAMRAAENIGHNQARMTFVATRRS